jgi:ankyrin repeat protein
LWSQLANPGVIEADMKKETEMLKQLGQIEAENKKEDEMLYRLDQLLGTLSRCNLNDIRDALKNAPDVNAKVNGKPLLYLATERNRADLAHFLIRNGADVKARGTRGGESEITHAPLHIAAGNGCLPIADLLLTEGADPRVTGGLLRDTPLHRAAHQGHANIAALLIEHGADVNARDFDGKTPLHEAALGNHAEVARLLIEAGADPNASADRSKGRTARGIAESYQHQGVLEVLGAQDASSGPHSERIAKERKTPSGDRDITG